MRRIVIGAVLALVSTLFVLVNPAAAATRYTVTAIPSATSVDVGQSFTVHGKVKPRARGEYALVQRLTSGVWTTVKRARINRWGNYRTSVTVTEAGDNKYRVLKRRSHGHLRGVSPTFVVVGWRWRSLTTLPSYGTTTHASILPSGTLGTTAYPVTYAPLVKLGDAAGNDGSVGYVLANNCTKFDSDVGVTTDSTGLTGQTAGLDVFATNGGLATSIASPTVTLNQDPVHIARSGAIISGAYAIRLTGQTDANTYVGWGGPRVYCKS